MRWLAKLLAFIDEAYEIVRGEYQTPISYPPRPPEHPAQPPVSPVAPSLPTNPPPMPTTPSTATQADPKPKQDMLSTFCTAIMNFEGGPGDPNHVNNNPGDFRCSPVGYLPKYGNVLCRNNFAVFPSFELGWEYLLNSVHYRAALHPTWSIYDFFLNYAPPSDNNPTLTYAATVAKACGVPVSTTLQKLFA